MSPLADRVRSAARATPDARAVHDETGWTTYGALDALADRLAGALAARGVGPGDRVGVWLDKSAVAVAAMQGALRVGAAYVPLDPASPPARIDRIVAGCGLVAVVADGGRADHLGGLAIAVDAVLTGPALPCPKAPTPGKDDLAYILYTSGSTGEPKGVCLTEGNAAAFVDWAVQTLEPGPHDVFANHAPFHFDLSVLDLYAAFSVGAAVCLVPEGIAYAPARLVSFLVERQITVWYSVPSALMLMMDQGALLDTPTDALRVVCFAGEPFPVAALRRLIDARPGVRFLNLYGPTETNVCTAYEVLQLAPERAEPVPIGVAVCGDRVWAADATGEEVAVGELGELWVCGPTVMAGYWGQPPHQGAYATGDLVRRLEDGNYVYAGRRDQMVKVRGHRVELGEIEAALLTHPAVAAAAVVVVGQGLSARLVAWLVGNGEGRPGLLAFKRHCAARLPRYMIVDRVQWLPRLPRTRNGKTDRRELFRLAVQGGDHDP